MHLELPDILTKATAADLCRALNELPDAAWDDGGELEFRQGDALHRLKLPAGQAVLYPSGTVHRVLPVTRGARLACFFWVQSLVADDAERHILHQLDQHLTALRSRLGESEETVGLVATYHNLLRRWSQTG